MPPRKVVTTTIDAAALAPPPRAPKFKMDAAADALLLQAFRQNSKPSKDETQVLADELTCQRSTVVAWYRSKRKEVEAYGSDGAPATTADSDSIESDECSGGTADASLPGELTKSQQQSIDRKRKAAPQWNDKWSEETAATKADGITKKVRVLEHTKAALIATLNDESDTMEQ